MSESSFHTVLFYNVENLFDTIEDKNNRGDDEFTPEGEKNWTEERYRHKLQQLSKAIACGTKSTPLCFGLVEIENRRVVEDLIQTGSLAERKYRMVHYNSEDPRGMDCAFVYDAVLLTITQETKLILRIPDEPSFRTRDILYIQGSLEGNPIHFFVNHWSSRREGTAESNYRRVAAAQLLRKQINHILSADEDANILVMGDFNDTPNDESIRNILRAKGQHEQQPGDLVNLLLSEQNKGNGTIVHQRDWEVFDQLIVSQGLMQAQRGISIVDYKARIVKKEELLYTFDNGTQRPDATYSGDIYRGGFSDHLPIYLELKIKPKKQGAHS